MSLKLLTDTHFSDLILYIFYTIWYFHWNLCRYYVADELSYAGENRFKLVTSVYEQLEALIVHPIVNIPNTICIMGVQWV